MDLNTKIEYSGFFLKKSNLWVPLSLTCHIKEHILSLFIGGCHKKTEKGETKQKMIPNKKIDGNKK